MSDILTTNDLFEELSKLIYFPPHVKSICINMRHRSELPEIVVTYYPSLPLHRGAVTEKFDLVPAKSYYETQRSIRRRKAELDKLLTKLGMLL